VADQRDKGETAADAEQRRDDRQAHREHRAEADQQDDRGRGDADALGGPAVGRLRQIDHVAAEIERHTLAGCGARAGHQRLHLAGGDLGRLHVERDGRERDVAVGRDPARDLIGAADRRDMRRVRQRGELAGDTAAHLGACDRTCGAYRQGERVTRLTGEMLVDQRCARVG